MQPSVPHDPKFVITESTHLAALKELVPARVAWIAAFEIVDVGSYIYITAMMMCTTDIINQPYSQLIPFSCAKSVYRWLMGDRISNIQVNIYLTQLLVRPLSVLLTVVIKLYCPITCYELRQWVLFVNCRWMSQKTVDDKTALVRVMAWCHQTTIDYPSQQWHRSMSPYVTMAQWGNFKRPVQITSRCPCTVPSHQQILYWVLTIKLNLICPTPISSIAIIAFQLKERRDLARCHGHSRVNQGT